MKVKRKNGEMYEPDTLTSFHRSFHRYLANEKNLPFNILKDLEFTSSRESLKAARKMLKKQGKGNRPQAVMALSNEDIEKLWQTGALGCSNPESLMHTVWFLVCYHMGMRGRDEHKKYCFGDFTIQSTSDGRKYIEYTSERDTKTRSGEHEYDHRTFKPKMWATPECPERCPVIIFEHFIKERPESMCKPGSPFYLAINWNNWTTIGSKWYKSQPLGINSINKFMKNISSNGELKGRKTNHSVRKTTVERLCQANVPDSTVIQVTGHRNIKSLNSYKKPSLNQQENISHLLSGYTPGQASNNTSIFTDVTNTTIDNSRHLPIHPFQLQSPSFYNCIVNFTTKEEDTKPALQS